MNFAYAATDAANISVNLSTWDAILNASPIVQLALVTLIFMSIGSWAIVFYKHKQIERARREDNKFEDIFWKANSLDDIFGAIDDFKGSSMARIFKAGYLELRKLADTSGSKDGEAPQLTGIDNLERVLRRSVDTEISILESRLSFLATTGSTGPFIGLFGTVWGIMSAFQKIGATGLASLAVVAPGISEALIATAIGLAAAIPATIAFNHYVSKIKRVELDLNGFSVDFLNIAKRNFFKER